MKLLVFEIFLVVSVKLLQLKAVFLALMLCLGVQIKLKVLFMSKELKVMN